LEVTIKSFIAYGEKFLIAIAIPAVLFLLCFALFPDRINLHILSVLLLQAIPPAILAWGVCFEIKTGLWDFSVGAVVLISGIIAGNLANNLHLGVIGVVVLCPVLGLLGGLLTGTVFTYLKIPSIITSIGMMLVLESISGLIFGGKGVLVSSDVYILARFPLNIIIGVAAFGLAYYLYNFRSFGYHVRAVGKGLLVAKLNGINVDRIRLLCFAVTGLFAGIFAFMQLGGAGVMQAQSNMTTMGVVLDAIICCCIALALEKVTNLVVGVFIGSVTTQIIKIGILVSGFPSMYQQVIIALFLLLFMGLSSRSDYIRKGLSRLKILKKPNQY
jgi:ribose transport system permease protein